MTAHRVALVPRRAGRRFAATRLVRLGDALQSGEARLDALARYLQDIAADDGRDAEIETNVAWLVRKTMIGVGRRPRLGEQLDLVTWASGSGARWAERRTTISVQGEPVLEAASIWVCVDVATRRPARIPAQFWAMYGEAVHDRTVSSRLTHPELPVDPPPDQRSWPLRVADFDVLGHVNNAATWAAVEDEIDRVASGRRVVSAELEYRGPIDPSHDTILASQVAGGVMNVWLAAQGVVLASAVVTFG